MNNFLLARLRDLSEAELYNELYTDPLTGVQNRRALDQLSSPVVAIIDLDSLKYFNDTYNHRVGDEHLCALAEGLVRTFGASKVFRLSGDEFVVQGYFEAELRAQLCGLRKTLPGFSFGVGTDIIVADHQLQQDKARRERLGKRAARGECPPWHTLLKEKQA